MLRRVSPILNAYVADIAYVSSAGNRPTKKRSRHKDSRGSSGSNGNSIKCCGAAKGDATWAGAQETHRWAWRLSLRGAPGRRDMKLYTGFAVEGIFPLSFSPDRLPRIRHYIPVAVAAGSGGSVWHGGTNK